MNTNTGGGPIISYHIISYEGRRMYVLDSFVQYMWTRVEWASAFLSEDINEGLHSDCDEDTAGSPLHT